MSELIHAECSLFCEFPGLQGWPWALVWKLHVSREVTEAYRKGGGVVSVTSSDPWSSTNTSCQEPNYKERGGGVCSPREWKGQDGRGFERCKERCVLPGGLRFCWSESDDPPPAPITPIEPNYHVRPNLRQHCFSIWHVLLPLFGMPSATYLIPLDLPGLGKVSACLKSLPQAVPLPPPLHIFSTQLRVKARSFSSYQSPWIHFCWFISLSLSLNWDLFETGARSPSPCDAGVNRCSIHVLTKRLM